MSGPHSEGPLLFLSQELWERRNIDKSKSLHQWGCETRGVPSAASQLLCVAIGSPEVKRTSLDISEPGQETGSEIWGTRPRNFPCLTYYAFPKFFALGPRLYECLGACLSTSRLKFWSHNTDSNLTVIWQWSDSIFIYTYCLLIKNIVFLAAGARLQRPEQKRASGGSQTNASGRRTKSCRQLIQFCIDMGSADL